MAQMIKSLYIILWLTYFSGRPETSRNIILAEWDDPTRLVFSGFMNFFFTSYQIILSWMAQTIHKLSNFSFKSI